jgi:hypothetical protein
MEERGRWRRRHRQGATSDTSNTRRHTSVLKVGEGDRSDRGDREPNAG